MDFLSKLNKKVSDINSEYTTTLYSDLPGFETLNSDPYVAVRDDVLSADICEYLIDNLDHKLTPSVMIGGQSQYRSSHDISLNPDVWSDVDKFRSDISDNIIRDPDTMEEPMLIRYLPGESYEPHLDALNLSNRAPHLKADSIGSSNVQRILTVLCYLNDVEQGGETYFPHLDISVRPQRGRVLVFHNVHENALLPNKLSLHQGISPDQGKKYIISCWYRLTTVEKINQKLFTDLSLVKQKVIFQSAKSL